MKVVSSKLVHAPIKVYDIGVKDAHHYILENGNVAHNTMDLYSKQQTGSGEGYRYAVDVSLILSKAQQKEGTERVGSIITLTIDKSRYIPEGQKFKILLLFGKGMYEYSSLRDLALEYGIWGKEGNSYVNVATGEKLGFAKKIDANPKTYFTQATMESLRETIMKKCGFGEGDISMMSGDDEDDDITTD